MGYNTFNPIVYKGLVLYLDAENLKSYSGYGLNWYDLTSNGNNGVLTNGATFSLSGNSIQFDGVNDYVSISNSNILTPNEITLSAWINRTQLGYYSQVMGVPINDVSWNNPFRRYGFEFIDSTNTMGFTLGFTDNTYQSVTCNTFGLYEWFNITGTYDGSTINVYINGVLSTSVPETKALINSTSNFYIGSENTSSIYPFIGKIGCVHLYNRALTPAEILQNYNATKWRFINELPSIVTDQLVLNLDAGDPSSYTGSGTSWYDLTANSHNGTLTNGAYYDPSDSGVMIFDGINDYVNVGSLGSGFGSFTLDMWFNSGSVTDYKNIIDFNGWNTGLRIEQYSSPGYYLNWPNNGYSRARMAIIINITDGFFGFGADCPGVITDNTWYNLVVTFDGDYCSIYINNEKLVDNYLVPSGFVGYINNMRIGDGFDYSGRRFQGKIPVVRIYDKALTSTEVLQNFNAQKNRYGL